MSLEVYFSHSWKPEHIDLNIMVWKIVAPHCALYVDHEGAEGGEYYINRLEELIRKSDLFIGVLAYRDDVVPVSGKNLDYQLRCSPAALFELRLAERARKPRWVLYDERTGLRPVQAASDLVEYTVIDGEEELQRGGPMIAARGERWIRHVLEVLKPGVMSRSRQAALLIDETRPDAGEVTVRLRNALRAAGYGEVTVIQGAHTDAEVIGILQTSGLLVAEIGGAATSDIYGMALAMFIPTIRILRPGGDMPRMLDGHPGGYQHDPILFGDIDSIVEAVRKRAEAMRDRRTAIRGEDAGCAYFRRRRYADRQVFVSHNLRSEDADLLRLVFDKLRASGIRAWEYRHENKAGESWKTRLEEALGQATDALFVLGDGYELSSVCTEELEAILARGDRIRTILPFFWGGRDRPNPKLAALHHESLPGDKAAAAQAIVDRLMKAL